MQLLLLSVRHKGPQSKNDAGHTLPLLMLANKKVSGWKLPAPAMAVLTELYSRTQPGKRLLEKLTLKMCCHSLTTFASVFLWFTTVFQIEIECVRSSSYSFLYFLPPWWKYGVMCN